MVLGLVHGCTPQLSTHRIYGTFLQKRLMLQSEAVLALKGSDCEHEEIALRYEEFKRRTSKLFVAYRQGSIRGLKVISGMTGICHTIHNFRSL